MECHFLRFSFSYSSDDQLTFVTILGLGGHRLIAKFDLSQLSFDPGNVFFSNFRAPSRLPNASVTFPRSLSFLRCVDFFTRVEKKIVLFLENAQYF